MASKMLALSRETGSGLVKWLHIIVENVQSFKILHLTMSWEMCSVATFHIIIDIGSLFNFNISTQEVGRGLT